MFQHRATFPQVLAAAALAGFGLGLCSPAWHVALEPAQLLAGVVRYPVATPFQLYETQVWNVWHQLLALLLAAGCSERTLTIVLSGGVTALAFAAVAGFARALGANAPLALAAPFLVLLNGRAQPGFNYPILFLGHGHTYGMAGLAWLALALTALATERWRLAGFLVGLAPALHASLGAWLAIAIGLAALPALPSLRPHLRALCAGIALGAGLCALSLGVHLWLTPAAPPSDPASAERYLTAFVRLWDAHRVSPDLGARTSFLVWCSGLTALALLRMQRERLGAGAALALRVLLVCAAIGFAVSIVQPQLVLERIPKLLLIAMPTRLANLVALLSVPLALAVIWRFRDDPLPRVLLLAAIGLLALELRDPVWWRRIDLVSTGAPLLGIAAVVALARATRNRRAAALIAAGLLGWLLLRALWRGLAHPAWLGLPGELSLDLALGGFVAAWFAFGRSGSEQAQRRPAWALDAALGAALAAIALGIAATSIASWSEPWQELRDRTNEPVLAQAARGEGLLLVGPGLDTVQARTRRPLLLDPSALDMLPYVLSVGPEVEAILREAYGIEFFHPPGQALEGGVLPDKPVRVLFARRTADDWREIRARFGVTELLVKADWKLQLPELARGGRYALYALPQ
jgi:hypothetical protein